MTNPPPRPALHKAPDAALHPASPQAGALAMDLAPPAAEVPHGRKARKEPDPGPMVELTLRLPKALRKQLKVKAAEHGCSPEEAAVQLLRRWVDG